MIPTSKQQYPRPKTNLAITFSAVAPMVTLTLALAMAFGSTCAFIRLKSRSSNDADQNFFLVELPAVFVMIGSLILGWRINCS